MSGWDWIVIAAAAAAIVWVNWYFFLAGRGPIAAEEDAPRAGPGGVTDR